MTRLVTASIVLGCLGCLSGDQVSPSDPAFITTNAVGSVSVSPSPASVVVPGGTAQLSAQVLDPNGTVIPPSSVPVTWTSLSPTRVTVNATGQIKAVATSGRARIAAAAGGKADTVTVNLITRPSATLSTVAASGMTIALTAPTALTITARDSLSRPITGAVVTISSTGSGNAITVNGVTDSLGRATATYSSSVAEPKTLTASVSGVALARTISLTVSTDAVIPITQCPLPVLPPAGSVNVATDIPYGSAPTGSQKLDIAWPRTGGSHPLVLLIHGGGWSGGDKSDFAKESRILASLGYTAISVNYRLVNGTSNIFPAAIQDLRCALRWIRTMATSYGYDPDHIAVVGSSAGAHLTELLGLAYTSTKLDGVSCQNPGPMAGIQALIAISVASDLRKSSLFTSQSLPTIAAFLGGLPESVPGRADLASPITHVQIGDPKTLLIHGATDPVLPLAHATSLRTALTAAKVPATLVTIGSLGHGIRLFGGTTSTVGAACTALEFLKQEL